MVIRLDGGRFKYAKPDRTAAGWPVSRMVEEGAHRFRFRGLCVDSPVVMPPSSFLSGWYMVDFAKFMLSDVGMGQGVLEWACSLAAVWGRRVFSPIGYVF